MKRCGNMFIVLIIQCVTLSLTNQNLAAGCSSEMGKALVYMSTMFKFEFHRIKNAEIVPN